MMNSDKKSLSEIEESVVRYRQANHARHMRRYVKCAARQAREETNQTTVEEFIEELPVEFEVQPWEL